MSNLTFVTKTMIEGEQITKIYSKSYKPVSSLQNHQWLTNLGYMILIPLIISSELAPEIETDLFTVVTCVLHLLTVFFHITTFYWMFIEGRNLIMVTCNRGRDAQFFCWLWQIAVLICSPFLLSLHCIGGRVTQDASLPCFYCIMRR